MDSDKLFEALQEIKQDVAVIKSEMTLMKKSTPKIDEVETRVAVLETKIKGIESNNNRVWGVIGTIVAGIGLAVAKSFLGGV